MNKLNLVIIGTLFFIVVVSCSSFTEGKQLAQSAADEFHSDFNNKKFSRIYEKSDSEFKKNTDEKEFAELINAVYEKLGKVENSSQINWNVNVHTSGTFATVTYDVDFSEGKGSETFVFKINNDKALLYNYNVNSPLLLTK